MPGLHSAVLLQSSTNGPTPMMPFAPKSSTVFLGVPVQLDGGLPVALAPMSCNLTPLAVCPEVGIVMSAVTTEPQLVPSANCRHSAIGLFKLSSSDGSLRETAEAISRRPIEPVSTST